MAMTKQTKQFLAIVGTGVVTLGLAVFALVKSNSASRAKKDAEKARTELVDSYKEKAALRKDSIATHDTLRLVRNENDSLRAVVVAKDSIIADRDTAIAVLTRDLQDCKDNKQPVAKKPAQTKKPVAKNPEVKKPAEKKPEVKKPAEKKPEVKKPVEKKPEVKKPVEKKPEVKKPDCVQKPACEEKPAVHIEFNDDSHDNVVNVNNGVVINNNYNTVVDTIRAAQKKIQYSVGKAYTGRTVRCQ